MYRVIIVEDEPEIARSTKRFVEKKADFQVTAIFSNGQEDVFSAERWETSTGSLP